MVLRPPLNSQKTPCCEFPLQGWQQRKGGGKVQLAFFLSIPLPLPSVVEVLLPPFRPFHGPPLSRTALTGTEFYLEVLSVLGLPRGFV